MTTGAKKKGVVQGASTSTESRSRVLIVGGVAAGGECAAGGVDQAGA